MPIDPQVKRYKDAVLSAPYEICIERARYWTESHQKTRSDPPPVRAAKALAHTLWNMTIHIREDERIAGNRSSKLLGTIIPVERGDINSLLSLELKDILTREDKPFLLDKNDRRELEREILPYWKGKTVRDRKKQLWKNNGLYFRPAVSIGSLLARRKGLDLKKLRQLAPPASLNPLYLLRAVHELCYNNPAFAMNVFDVQGHLVVGHKNILEHGFSHVHAEAQARQAAANESGDEKTAAFFEGVAISCEAMRDFAHRFTQSAEQEADKATNPARRDDLLAIAARCRHVPWHPPRDFREAVQALWLTQVGAIVSHGMPGILAVGRLDQLLGSFYEKDRSTGRIDQAAATALMEELLLKLTMNVLVLPRAGVATGSELGADSCSPTIGGVDREGRDAVNELSYRILDAYANVKGTGNSFMVRLSEKNPACFWEKTLSTSRAASGIALFNDEVVVEAMVRNGYERKDARDFALVGCVEPTGQGDTFACTSGNDISLAAALEMTLYNGATVTMGRRFGPSTGDPKGFISFEQFLAAFKRQVDFLVETVARATNEKDRAYEELLPCPLVSATLDGCIENGRDMTAGGARYNFGSIGARGLGTVVDALAAVKRFVYDEHTLTMAELLRLVSSNFAGGEIVRTKLERKAPKFGRDQDEADRLAAEVVNAFCGSVTRRQTLRGGPYRPGFFSYGMHVMDGLMIGALPNGRRAGFPVSNSFSPSNGTETHGPTATLRSLAKIDQRQIGNGNAVNMIFSPAMLAGAERVAKMVALVRGYFGMGGMELQPNVLSVETLRDAQTNPQDYRDLVVRVSGYSAYFTDLGKPLQDEIISRTVFSKY